MQINKVRVGTFTLESEGGYRDVAMLEECDSAVQTICKLCNWGQELDALVKGQGKSAASGSSVAKPTAEKGKIPRTKRVPPSHSPQSAASAPKVCQTHKHVKRQVPPKK